MPQSLADHLHRHPRVDEQRGVRVPQIMEAEGRARRAGRPRRRASPREIVGDRVCQTPMASTARMPTCRHRPTAGRRPRRRRRRPARRRWWGRSPVRTARRGPPSRHVGGPDERRVVPVDHGEDRLGILPPGRRRWNPTGGSGLMEHPGEPARSTCCEFRTPTGRGCRVRPSVMRDRAAPGVARLMGERRRWPQRSRGRARTVTR